MRRGEGALRQADDVRLGDLQMVEHVPGVVDRVALAVHRAALRHVGAWIAAERVGDAAVPAGEEADLRLPAPPVAAIFMDEQDRRAAARLLVIELYAIGCGRVWHGSPFSSPPPSYGGGGEGESLTGGTVEDNDHDLELADCTMAAFPLPASPV